MTYDTYLRLEENRIYQMILATVEYLFVYAVDVQREESYSKNNTNM